MTTPQADVLIIGSGPVGAAYARLLKDGNPKLMIVMVEAGPQLTEPPGRNIRNLTDPESQERARALASGPPAAASGSTLSLQLEGTITAREGTFLINPGRAARDGDDQLDLPAAATTSCVGGQGTLWTCATPRPRGSERSSDISDVDWTAHLAHAEQLLDTSPNAFADTPHLRAIQRRLASVFDAELPRGDGVRPLPVAGQPAANGRVEWAGVDTILGPLIGRGGAADGGFALRAETICREILHDQHGAVGGLLEHLPSGRREVLHARSVIVAGNALRTPQLLWASHIRPPALGRYLTEHPLTFAVVGLDPALVAAEGTATALTPTGLDPALAALCLPFSEPHHPFHAQFMHFDRPPLPVDDAAERYPAGFVAMGWGTRKFPRFEDYLEFSDEHSDVYGMPAIHCHYELTAADREQIDAALAHLRRAAGALGDVVPGGEPKLMPGGTSLHYQGTTRIGAQDDGESVCDTYSRVWGFPNLFLGGNGLIPTATACNPTLTGVALAVRASPRVLEFLAAG